jgi:hypothetical protein
LAERRYRFHNYCDLTCSHYVQLFLTEKLRARRLCRDHPALTPDIYIEDLSATEETLWLLVADGSKYDRSGSREQ